MIVRNEEEFMEAIGRKEDSILAHGRLAPKLERLYTMNDILWGVCIGCLAVAMAATVKLRPNGYDKPWSGLTVNRMKNTAGKRGMPEQMGEYRLGTFLQSSPERAAGITEQRDRFRSFREDYEMERQDGGKVLFRRRGREKVCL